MRRSVAGGPTRRAVLGGLGGLLAAPLAGCGSAATVFTTGAAGAATPTPARDRSAERSLVRWSNFPQYLDLDEATMAHPTLQSFEARTGIQVSYSEDIEDCESYYGQVHAQLRTGRDIGRDLVVLTDWMAARLVRAGWVQKLDARNMPNTSALADHLAVDYDPGRQYSMTWQSGYTGLAWNKRLLREATGLDRLEEVQDLWRPALRGRVEVLAEMRDTIGLIMLAHGVDVTADFERTDFDKAVNTLEQQLSNGQIRQVRGNSYADDLESGDAIAVVAWSGDVRQLNHAARTADPGLDEDPYGFAIPGAGGMLWSDNFLVPVGSPYKTNAELLVDHYYDPDVAARVAAYVHYVCPVEGAREAMIDLDPASADDPYIFPTEEFLSRVHVFRTLDEDEERYCASTFQAVLGL